MSKRASDTILEEDCVQPNRAVHRMSLCLPGAWSFDNENFRKLKMVEEILIFFVKCRLYSSVRWWLCLQDPSPLMWRVTKLSQISLGISLGYFLIDALLVAWYLPAVWPFSLYLSLSFRVEVFILKGASLSKMELRSESLVLPRLSLQETCCNLHWISFAQDNNDNIQGCFSVLTQEHILML